MTLALLPLAFGTMTSWLLAGPFFRFLGVSHPAGAHAVDTTGAFLLEIATSPWTFVALTVVAVGIAAWFLRGRLAGARRAFGLVGRLATDSFGFEAINRGVIATVQRSAEALRGSQTGVLSWNVFGILAGLVAVLLILALGGA